MTVYGVIQQATNREADDWREDAIAAVDLVAGSSWLRDLSEPFDPWGSVSHMLPGWDGEAGIRRAFAIAAAAVVAIHEAHRNGQPVAILDIRNPRAQFGRGVADAER